jgi:hypothetical protein
MACAVVPATSQYSPRSAAPHRLIQLSCSPKSRPRSTVGQPVAFVSNREILLATFANWLGGWSNVMADDFVERLTGRTEMENVAHRSKSGTSALASRLCRRLLTTNRPQPNSVSIPRGRCPKDTSCYSHRLGLRQTRRRETAFGRCDFAFFRLQCCRWRTCNALLVQQEQ